MCVFSFELEKFEMTNVINWTINMNRTRKRQSVLTSVSNYDKWLMKIDWLDYLSKHFIGNWHSS